MIRTQEPDPYTQEGSSDLLTEFQNFWNGQMNSVRRDVTHLLTGRDLSGAGTEIGLGYMDVICNNSSFSYALSGNYIVIVPGFTREVIVMAHELGHNWGAQHCGVLDCGIMSEAGTLLEDYFSDTSKSQINAHRQAHPQCLSSGQIYVDWRATAPFWGTALHPFRTLAEGLPAVPAAGSVVLRGDHQYPENLSIDRALTLRAEGGPVTVGQ